MLNISHLNAKLLIFAFRTGIEHQRRTLVEALHILYAQVQLLCGEGSRYIPIFLHSLNSRWMQLKIQVKNGIRYILNSRQR